MTTASASPMTAPSATRPAVPIVASYRARAKNEASSPVDDLAEDQIRAAVSDLVRRIDGLSTTAAVLEDEIPAPDSLAIRKAVRWIDHLYRDAAGDGRRWIEPLITSNHERYVVFEWWDNDRKLTVRLGPDETEAVKHWGPRGTYNREETTVGTEVERRRAWRWLTGNVS